MQVDQDQTSQEAIKKKPKRHGSSRDVLLLSLRLCYQPLEEIIYVIRCGKNLAALTEQKDIRSAERIMA